MEFFDDECESVPHSVSNYHFVDDKDELVSFSELPVQWKEGESSDNKGKDIFLHGSTDNGLQKIYKQVTAWKFDLSDEMLEILVLSTENNWIKLQKPRKSFEEIIRTILITVHCLHFVKNNPEKSGRSLWDHLSKVFSLYEVRPSGNDLVDHINIISEAVKRDDTLAKSKFLVEFLEEKPGKRKFFDEDVENTVKSGFIVDDDMIDKDDDMIERDEEDGSDEEEDLFDSVCAICDNGGNILCCEGRCMRSFHATVEAGSESMCKSLGFSDEQVEAIQNFFCKNCQHKKHQCFSCGELGSSDKSSGAEVFPCVSATCGYFYHPHCVAKLLHRESETDAAELQKKISAGESFTCPVHKCHVCKQGENKMVPELQFAVCRRCPKSYHRKCLPRKIAFEDLEEEDIIQRAWEDLLPNRILIYCLKHEINDEIGTPIRNHIKFPKDLENKKRRTSDLLSTRERVASRESNLASEDASRKRTVGKTLKGFEKLSSANKEGDFFKKSERRSSGSDFVKKQKMMDTSRKPLNKSASAKFSKVSTNDSGPSLGERLFALVEKGAEAVKSKKEGTPDSEPNQNVTLKPVAKETTSSLPLDADTKRRIMSVWKDASSSITLEQIIKKHKVPTTHAYSSRYVVDKTITMGKVEGSIEALRAALKKLEEGGSIEDAKAVCEPGLLNQIVKWKNKLKVYLAPFLFGMRYTSFGRHFTKVDKLKEIVNMLHLYVQDGDMIVDFCCGANDFSCLMKKKLDETGKKCSYKNYDVLQTKNDFNFEKRDWMSVRPKELPTGSQLIMGLNPPFGVNAALANKFISKALEFKPKLLILIVPQETERLDKKEPPYDLVWEDDELLAGKSFYLPGSVDVNDKQIDQWNVSPPPLYLWSRPDWTAKHKAIAQQHGHSSRVREESCLNENQHEMLANDFHPVENHDLTAETSIVIDDYSFQNGEPEQVQERASVTTDHKEGPCNNGDREAQKNHDLSKNLSNENPKKRQRDKGKHGKGSGEIAPEDRQKSSSSSVGVMSKGMARHSPHHSARRSPRHSGRPSARPSPPKVTGAKSLDGHPSKPLEIPLHTEVGNERQYNQIGAGSSSQFQTGYAGASADDMGRRYGLNTEERYTGVTHRYSSGVSPVPDYGVRNSEERIPGYQRESADNYGYRSSYIGEMDGRYGMEPDIRSQVPFYGRQDHDPLSLSSSYLAGQNPGFQSSFGQPGLATESSYSTMGTSTMQRYAPRLDELNHTRANPLAPDLSMMRRHGSYDPLAPRPGYGADTLGFAPGPYGSYSQRNSSGWLNE
ncbi:protein ENHANCED DOWNY MILDEW 2 [Cornus florida]|uniref:protein ENHANCED DOWNY MILDEW 2 n=1 Tax=Cornus florida TaxID=4283 RepID=UPI0028A248E7|nr:protein ENHANCED DOWNY MILDEW 2 [Cornus florida]XP_059666482.1 protein ENHANCED DOWNY MILDEW 2 [Cornus florida]